MNTPAALFAGLLGLSLAACGGHEVVRPTVDVSIGQQLIGKKVGDAVTITTPKGELTYEVEKIS